MLAVKLSISIINKKCVLCDTQPCEPQVLCGFVAIYNDIHRVTV